MCSENKDLLQPNLFGVKHIYFYNPEGTSSPDHPCPLPRAAPTFPWPSALGWDGGMGPECPALPSPTQGAPNFLSPRIHQTWRFWRKSYF